MQINFSSALSPRSKSLSSPKAKEAGSDSGMKDTFGRSTGEKLLMGAGFAVAGLTPLAGLAGVLSLANSPNRDHMGEKWAMTGCNVGAYALGSSFPALAAGMLVASSAMFTHLALNSVGRDEKERATGGVLQSLTPPAASPAAPAAPAEPPAATPAVAEPVAQAAPAAVIAPAPPAVAAVIAAPAAEHHQTATHEVSTSKMYDNHQSYNAAAVMYDNHASYKASEVRKQYDNHKSYRATERRKQYDNHSSYRG